MRRRRGGDDGATTRRRRDDDDATTMRRDDDATRRCGHGDGAGESLQPSGAPHSRCRSAVAAAPMVPLTVAAGRDPRGWVRIAVEATTTRRSDDEAQRRRCGDDDATTRRVHHRCSRCSPSRLTVVAAPAASQALTVAAAPQALTSLPKGG